MFKRFIIVIVLVVIYLDCCFGTGQQAGSNFEFSKSTFDKVLQENKQLRQEINSIRDSLRSVSLFIKSVEQSNKGKQLDGEKQLLQQQLRLNAEMQAINTKRRNLSILLAVTFSLLSISIVLLIYAIFKLRRNSTLSNTSHSVLKEKEYDYKQKLIIENITARIEAQETERERISRELHDGVGGNLVAIRLLLQSVDSESPILNELQRLVANTQHEIRAMSHNLSSPRLDEIPFEQLFFHHIEQIKRTTDIQIEGTLLPKQGWSRLQIKLQSEIYRLLQELSGNIIKHSKATKVNISLRLDEETISLLAEDNGIGFIVDKGYEGIGLQNIKLRVNSLNGQIDINSTPGDGTTIMVEIPIKHS